MNIIFAVNISQSIDNLFHKDLALLFIDFTNDFWKVPIGAVLKDDS